MAEVIFRGIKDYGLFHSSHFTIDAVTEATRQGLPSIKEYLESQMKEFDHFLEQKAQNGILESRTATNFSMGEYGSLVSKVWVAEREIQRGLFDPSKALQPTSLKFLDLPHVYKQTSDGFAFIEALNEMAGIDLEIFGLKSVQLLIDGHLAYWDGYNLYAVGLPLVI